MANESLNILEGRDIKSGGLEPACGYSLLQIERESYCLLLAPTVLGRQRYS